MDATINAENKKQDRQKPSLSVGRIAGEILAGEGVGIAVALPIRYVFGTTDAFQSEFSGFAELSLFAFVLLPVYVLVSAVGVYLVGSIGKQTGSFLATLGFGFLGGIVLFINSFLVFTNTFQIVVESIGLWKYLVLVLLIPPIIATIGFNSTRRWRSPSQTGFRGTTLALLLLAVSPTLVIGVWGYPRLQVRRQMTRMTSGTATLRELIKGLKSSDWRVRKSAAGGLAKLGPKAKPAVPALTEALKYRDTVDCASHVLAAIGPDAEPAIPALVEAIRRAPRILAESGPRYDSFQKNAAQALAMIGPASLPALNELLKDEQAYARRCAADALGMMGPAAKPAAPALTDALRDEDEVVRQRARAALERIDPNSSQTVGQE